MLDHPGDEWTSALKSHSKSGCQSGAALPYLFPEKLDHPFRRPVCLAVSTPRVIQGRRALSATSLPSAHHEAQDSRRISKFLTCTLLHVLQEFSCPMLVCRALLWVSPGDRC